jgi:hypothetical protein
MVCKVNGISITMVGAEDIPPPTHKAENIPPPPYILNCSFEVWFFMLLSAAQPIYLPFVMPIVGQITSILKAAFFYRTFV